MVPRSLAWKLTCCSLPYLLLFACTAHNSFFFDTVQFASDHPNFYFNNHFRYLLLPDAIDSGHPPAFGMYLALVWMVFGRTLFVSHAAMLPFIGILVFQAVTTGNLLFPAKKKYSWFIPAIILSECVLIGQCALVSPDILVAAFFLLALNAILKSNKLQLALAVLLLAMLSMRAMMACGALYCFYFALHYSRNRGSFISFLLKTAIPFIPGALLALAFFAYHYYVKGWIGYHAGSTWASSFERADSARIVHNLLFLAWRFVDLGKLITVLVFALLTLAFLKNKNNPAKADVQAAHMLYALWILVASLLLFTALPLCLYRDLLAHRYLLPAYFSIAITAVFLLAHLDIRHKNAVFALMLLCQLSGHFWNYPRYISQGWDSTLAHLPFYSMRRDFKKYMRQQAIGPQQVGAYFTLTKSDFQLNLEGDTTPYRNYETDSVLYIWYCNVCNSPMDEHFSDYTKHWSILKREKKGNVEMILFRK